ncbi:hypothetical protein SAMN05421810_101850 [Amycolatopsis arida]|uniref:Uncharacterized protein n=1 Tax=Amycolatopsis arida TaxID=587909 RepID=A0A1I5MA10_9PSEU|nr:hypothetical protein CLV69_104482 [Amycolatopsis arida]SFP06412.1 hypothetical protein SAMN05421810_101850 [Amycolatopsis arida]
MLDTLIDAGLVLLLVIAAIITAAVLIDTRPPH